MPACLVPAGGVARSSALLYEYGTELGQWTIAVRGIRI